MNKLPIGSTVHVNGYADQAPFERIAEDGTIIEHARRGYLVNLHTKRENLIFKRRELSLIKT